MWAKALLWVRSFFLQVKDPEASGSLLPGSQTPFWKILFPTGNHKFLVLHGHYWALSELALPEADIPIAWREMLEQGG